MGRSSKGIAFFLIAFVATAAIFVLCVGFGSTGFALEGDIVGNIRLPRVLTVGLIGASLSICGAAMQGLLRNPLADGTTLGVSSGASLGAVIAIICTSNLPFLAGEITQGFSILLSMAGAFVSLLLIMALAQKVDARLSTNTIILVGVVFSMFASAFISLLVALFPNSAKTVTFWTMGSTASAGYVDCAVVGVFFVLCCIVLLGKTNELNTFAIGEENASHLGVNVKRTKMLIMVAVSILVGACVSVSGTIGFVGLVVPHISRMIVGANHKKLLPFSIFFGAGFLMLADLLCRTIIAPRELPIGVVTSLIGAVIFVYVFYKSRKGAK